MSAFTLHAAAAVSSRTQSFKAQSLRRRTTKPLVLKKTQAIAVPDVVGPVQDTIEDLKTVEVREFEPSSSFFLFCCLRGGNSNAIENWVVKQSGERNGMNNNCHVRILPSLVSSRSAASSSSSSHSINSFVLNTQQKIEKERNKKRGGRKHDFLFFPESSFPSALR